MSASRLSAWAMALRMDSSRLRCSNICVSEGDGFWERRFDGFGMILVTYHTYYASATGAMHSGALLAGAFTRRETSYACIWRAGSGESSDTNLTTS